MEITGVIHSGAGKGAFFTQVQWVVNQCEQMLGYKPYPGTLNIHVLEGHLSVLPTLFQKSDFELIPDDPAFCSAQVRKVTVNGVPGAVILPSEEVRIHGTNVLEVIASCGLKEALGLDDGDQVTVAW
jgi:riboflavin kinase